MAVLALQLLLCLACVVSVAAGTAAGPVITSISGCVDVGVTTLNCSLPVILTVRGSGFLTGITAAGPFYSTNAIYYLNPQPQFSAAAIQAGYTRPYGKAYGGGTGRFAANDTQFVFQLIYLGQDVYPLDTLMSLTIVLSADSITEIVSPPFLGLSIASSPQPDITSISGCPVTAADGSSTSLCLPDVHVLTVWGSGFLQWDSAPIAVVIGATSSRLVTSFNPTVTNWNAIHNDSCMLISLRSMYRDLLLAGDFGAPLQTFAIRESVTGWSSRVLHIQFAQLPLPLITTLAPYQFYRLDGLPVCVWGVNRTSIVNCSAGGPGLEIGGHYLYELQVTVGGQPCPVMPRAQQDTLWTHFTLPLYNFEANTLYDLTITSPAGTVTYPKYVSFSAAPVIVSAACRDPTLPLDIGSVGCQVGETLLLNGPNFPPPSTPFSVIIYSQVTRSNVTCANPRYNSPMQLACDLTSPGLPAVAGWDSQFVSWSTGVTLAITGRYDAWDVPSAPRIRAVSASGGCGNPVKSNDRTLSGCQGGELLTFYGSNFLSDAYSMVIQPVTLDATRIINYLREATQCLGLDVLDDNTAICEMPRPDDTQLLPYDAPMMMFMWNATSWDRSNALFFTIDSSWTPPSPASSSSSAVKVALGVVFGLLGLVALLLVVLFLRRRQSKGQFSPRGGTDEGRGGVEQRESSWFQLAERQS